MSRDKLGLIAFGLALLGFIVFIKTGTHADLILRSGLYARLAKLQFTDQ